MPEKPAKLMPALYGGIIIGVISGIPFLNFVNCLCCAGVLFGGFMAVFFYKNDLTPAMSPLVSGDGIQLGALAGIIGAVISLVISYILILAIGNVAGQAMYDMITSLYDSLGILDQIPPESLDQMQQSMMEGELSPMSIVMTLILYPLFGLLGGLIGYSVFKPKGPATPAVSQTPAQG